ncbi:MAG: hypothetical protein ACM3O4_04550 [Ignavibacteriales bacterium]
MKEKQKKVLIYTLYDECFIDYSISKEEALKKYCNDKGYKVVKIIREGKHFSFREAIDSLLEIINHSTETYHIVAYEIGEMTDCNEHIVTYGTILKESGFEFETIMQGKFEKNYLFTGSVIEDVNNDNKELKKYIVSEDSPF